MSLSKNQNVELYIDSFTSEGSGVGRYENMAVFVSGAAAGDKVTAHIIKAKKTYAVARVEKVLRPAKSRIMPACPYFPSCGGCAFQHISYEKEKEHKKKRVEDAFSHIAHINIEAETLLSDNKTTCYRNKAQYPVSFDRQLKIGFFAPRSHRVVDCENCILQPPIFADIVKIFRKFIIKNGITVYDSEKHTGLLRHIYLRLAEATGEVMVCAVINGEDLPHKNELIKKLTEIPSVKSIVLNINRDRTNVILGKECVTVWGNDCIYDVLCGVKVRLSPLSFYQVNHDMAQQLYEKAAEYACLSGKETVLDMYCGTGTIGLSMAKKAKRIIGAEIVPEAVLDAKRNALENGIENAEFICADAGEAAQELSSRGIKPDVVLLDPPRKGCSEMLLAEIVKMSPERIVYVSCDPSTLARDCSRLKDLGYETKRLAAADLFPRTVHVETVVLLSHKKPDGHINVKVEFGEGEGKVPLDNIAKRAESYKPKERVTYKMIKEYIEAKYGFKVHTAYIAEVKRDLGLPMYDAPNAVEELKQPRKHPTVGKGQILRSTPNTAPLICGACNTQPEGLSTMA